MLKLYHGSWGYKHIVLLEGVVGHMRREGHLTAGADDSDKAVELCWVLHCVMNQLVKQRNVYQRTIATGNILNTLLLIEEVYFVRKKLIIHHNHKLITTNFCIISDITKLSRHK